MSSDVYRLAFVLLAGGKSSRYDGNKLLSEHPITKVPLVQHSVYEVIRARDETVSIRKHPVTVVVGKWHDGVSSQLTKAFCGPTKTPIKVIHNTQWEEGIASSIRSGLSHLLSLSLHPKRRLKLPRFQHFRFQRQHYRAPSLHMCFLASLICQALTNKILSDLLMLLKLTQTT